MVEQQGLITALILKSRFSSLKIDIVKSDKIGIIGVGDQTILGFYADM